MLHIKCKHYENTPMQYTDFSQIVKVEIINFDITLIIAQNIYCGHILEPPRSLITSLIFISNFQVFMYA